MDNKTDCLDCCSCVLCAFTGEFQCEKENKGFPDKCDEFKQCYKKAEE